MQFRAGEIKTLHPPNIMKTSHPSHLIAWRFKQQFLGGYNALFGPADGIHGLTGSVRIIICLLISLRFIAHSDELSLCPFYVPTGWLLISFITLYLGYLFWSGVPPFTALRKKNLGISEAVPSQEDHTLGRVVWLEILGDIVFFTLIYGVSMKPASDTFFFYMLPLFTAIVFFDYLKSIRVVGIILALMLTTTFALFFGKHYFEAFGSPPIDLYHVLADIVFPRSVIILMAIPFALSLRKSREVREQEVIVLEHSEIIRSRVTERGIYDGLIDGIAALGFDRSRIYALNPKQTHFVSFKLCGYHTNPARFCAGEFKLALKDDAQLAIWDKRAIRCTASDHYSSNGSSSGGLVLTKSGWTHIVDDPYCDELDKQDVAEWVEILILVQEVRESQSADQVDDVQQSVNHKVCEECYGKVTVDNKTSQRPIFDSDIFCLSVLSTAAADALRRLRYREEISQASSIIGHDVRTFLAQCTMHSRNLKDPLVSESTRSASINKLPFLSHLGELSLDGAYHKLRLDLDDVKVKPTNLPLYELLSPVIETYRLYAKDSNIEFYENTPPNFESLIVRADISLCLVVHNLLQNAIDYMPDTSYEKQVTMTIREQGVQGNIEILIHDTGAGMTEEEQDKIFEPRYRGAASGIKSGSGIGLTIVKDIIQRHDGSIKVWSQIAVGTTFTVMIPRGE